MESKSNDWVPLMVTVRCCTFNQARYIRDCLDGFVMQQTNFHFEVIVHDDASTDGNADIIKEYGDKYPNIIKPILETENQWSKRDGSLGRIMDSHTHGKYVAWCEGDDYWIDPLKLQKQVDFLETHPEYSMCWTDAYQESDGKRTPYSRYSESCQSPMEDIIEKGGGFIPTCSIMMRRKVYEAMPKEAKGWYVGDYPLQMWAGWSGKVWYMKDQACVYRYMAVGSWTAGMNKYDTSEMYLKMYRNEKPMMDAFNKLTEYKYNDSFERYEATVFYNHLLWAHNYNEARKYLKLRKKHGIHTGKAETMLIQGHPYIAKLIGWLSSLKK